MKSFLRTVRQYYLFTAALAGLLVGAGLQIGGQHIAANAVLAVVTAAECIPFFVEIWRDLQTGKYGVDILAAVAVVSSLLLHQFWAAIVIILMLTGGRALEDYASHRAERELTALLEHAPQKARVLRSRKEVEIKASEVRKGDRLIIRAGELVAADAQVEEGTASFDESSLTGESMPVVKRAGDLLLSGSINIDGPVTAKAVHAAEDSQYQQIIRLVKAAQASQAPFTRLADRYSVPFTLLSFAIAITAWVISGHALRFLEVLVVATPCPLLLAVPIALISGMSRASRLGIIVKSGTALERLAQARTFAFDKTGTLTRGQLKVEKVTTFGRTSRTHLLGLSASLEQHSTHAQAAAIVAHAQAEHAKLVQVKQVREIAGKGLSAIAKGQDILLGRRDFLDEHHVAFPKGFKDSDYQQTSAFVAIDGQLAGAITFADEIRPETAGTLDRLRALGITDFLMITGDHPGTAQKVARKLGISDVLAGALPGDKIRMLEGVAKRPVAFVGDGVNDAPVLTASDVGVALGARGSAAASESADVVIMQDDFARLADGVHIARRTFGIAKQSVLVGIGLSVALMFVFATGKFLPIYGALVQEVVDVVVIFNALRAHRG